jgi:hypothetical protein
VSEEAIETVGTPNPENKPNVATAIGKSIIYELRNLNVSMSEMSFCGSRMTFLTSKRSNF